MKYPPYKQSIKWNGHLINNQLMGISMGINTYKQSIKWNIHPINNQSMGIPPNKQ